MALKLPIVDVATHSGVGGPQTLQIHAAQIDIPALNHVYYGRFAGAHLAAGGFPHRALIGRDFLRYCTFTYDGRTGRTILSNDLP